MKTTKQNLISFDEYLDKEYGKVGSPKRDKYEQGFEAFKLGVALKQMRKQNNLTQEQLAEKCGTIKTYISRIENDASDIRLSTLMRIVNIGLGGNLRLTVDYK
jgi:HTH-type transcriptional regulator / antitoxin HipB